MLRYRKVAGLNRNFCSQPRTHSHLLESVDMFYRAARERLSETSDPMKEGRYSKEYFNYLKKNAADHQKPDFQRREEDEIRRLNRASSNQSYRGRTEIYEKVAGRGGMIRPPSRVARAQEEQPLRSQPGRLQAIRRERLHHELRPERVQPGAGPKRGRAARRQQRALRLPDRQR